MRVRAGVHHTGFPVSLLRGGVDGLPPARPPKPGIAFFSAGLRIWKEHIRFSSTVIMAPALSNSPLGRRARGGQYAAADLPAAGWAHQ